MPTAPGAISDRRPPRHNLSLNRLFVKTKVKKREKSKGCLSKSTFIPSLAHLLSCLVLLLYQQYHTSASVTQVVGTTNFPPSFAAAGYASCFKGFG